MPDTGLTVKRIEKTALAAEERHQALLNGPTDPGLTFEATGLDSLVDEAHDYKNLATASTSPTPRSTGRSAAEDLHMKAELLRPPTGTGHRHGHRHPDRQQRHRGPVVQRYVRPDLLDAAGVQDFDSWAVTFGQLVTELEMVPVGAYRLKTRFARFRNVPEMLRMWQAFADVKTGADLNLRMPASSPPGHPADVSTVLITRSACLVQLTVCSVYGSFNLTICLPSGAIETGISLKLAMASGIPMMV
ncbi:MAG TPA: hypothetical protein VIU11_07140, partial [Nakamurella sp.]